MRQLAVTALGSRLEAVRHKPYGLQPFSASALNLTAYGLPPMAAASRFRRYGPTDSHEVRQPDVKGQTYVEQARKVRQMLRSMKPEAVSQITEFHSALNLFEALALAQREGKLIVPNDIHDRILMETTNNQYFSQNYALWTGTLVIYGAPNKPFGEQVVSRWKDDNYVKYSISFNVPKQFRGKKNCALVVEHPDFEIRRISKGRERSSRDLSEGQTGRDQRSRDFDLIDLGNNRYELKVDEQSIRLIQDFPEISGWYMPHAETGIPHGKKVEVSSDSRYLWRITNGSYLGPVCRDYFGVNRRQSVDVDCRSTYRFGVALMPLADAPKQG